MIDKWGMLIAEMHRSDERKHISCYILSPMLNLTLGFYLKFQTKDNMLPLAGKICRQLEFMVIIFSISFHTVESCSTISKLHKWSWKFRIYSIILHKWGGGWKKSKKNSKFDQNCESGFLWKSYGKFGKILSIRDERMHIYRSYIIIIQKYFIQFFKCQA